MEYVKRFYGRVHDYLVFVFLILSGVAGIYFSQGNAFGEFLSLYIMKPAIKMSMVMMIAEFSFRKVDFVHEILDRNTSVGLVFLAIALVVCESL